MDGKPVCVEKGHQVLGETLEKTSTHTMTEAVGWFFLTALWTGLEVTLQEAV